MRLVSIASGSSGNCIYVGTDKTHILIDAGISNKRIELGLKEIGVSPNDISGLFITHEHSDHTKGIGVLSRKHEIPIYATKETLIQIDGIKQLGEYSRELFHPILPDDKIAIGDLNLTPFSIRHDAANPVAYRVENETSKVAVATDIGEYDSYTIDHLQGLDAILLESNHDVNMVEAGPYPYYLKKRILGKYGHLSNENAGRLLTQILHGGLKHILLGHLSNENNYEALAYETVKCEIDQGHSIFKSSDFQIEVAKRDAMSQIVYV